MDKSDEIRSAEEPRNKTDKYTSHLFAFNQIETGIAKRRKVKKKMPKPKPKQKRQNIPWRWNSENKRIYF